MLSTYSKLSASFDAEDTASYFFNVNGDNRDLESFQVLRVYMLQKEISVHIKNVSLLQRLDRCLPLLIEQDF